MRLFIICLLLVAAMPLRADPVESAIVAEVRADLPQALELLAKVVNMNSGTMNFAGVRRVGAVFEQELKNLGFTTEWVDGKPFQRAGHVVAKRPGAGPKIVLIGHLDTVFAEDSPFQKYQVLEEQRAAGPGVTDMKGGNVILLYALRAMAAAGVLDRLSLTVVLTGDEEKRGHPIELASAPIVQAARWADVAIGFEDGDGNPKTAVVARRGSSRWQLTVTGRPAHSSQIFSEAVGAGAIFEAARILDQFRRELTSDPNLTFNPGLIVGGTEVSLDTESARGQAFGKDNVIAEHAQVSGDIRALSVAQREQAKQRMQQIVAASLPHSQAQITFEDSYPPMASNNGNQQLLHWYDEVSRDLGHGPVVAVDPRNAGAADISFAAAHVMMAIDGIGLMGWGGHTVDEVADLNTLPVQIERAAVLLYRLSTRLRGNPAANGGD